MTKNHESMGFGDRLKISIDWREGARLTEREISAVEFVLGKAIERLRCSSAEHQTSLSESIEKRPRKKPEITDEERERRRQRMKDYWKQRQAASASPQPAREASDGLVD